MLPQVCSPVLGFLCGSFFMTVHAGVTKELSSGAGIASWEMCSTPVGSVRILPAVLP